MNKNTIKLISGIAVTFIIYLLMTIWLYIGAKDSTGWQSLGIVVFLIVIVLPIYSVLFGIVGQILYRKIWLSAVINTSGAAVMLVSVLVLVKDSKPVILAFIPAVFVVTLAFSGIVFLFQRVAKGKSTQSIDVNQINTDGDVK